MSCIRGLHLWVDCSTPHERHSTHRLHARSGRPLRDRRVREQRLRLVAADEGAACGVVDRSRFRGSSPLPRARVPLAPNRRRLQSSRRLRVWPERVAVLATPRPEKDTASFWVSRCRWELAHKCRRGGRQRYRGARRRREDRRFSARGAGVLWRRPDVAPGRQAQGHARLAELHPDNQARVLCGARCCILEDGGPVLRGGRQRSMHDALRRANVDLGSGARCSRVACRVGALRTQLARSRVGLRTWGPATSPRTPGCFRQGVRPTRNRAANGAGVSWRRRFSRLTRRLGSRMFVRRRRMDVRVSTSRSESPRSRASSPI